MRNSGMPVPNAQVVMPPIPHVPTSSPPFNAYHGMYTFDSPGNSDGMHTMACTLLIHLEIVMGPPQVMIMTRTNSNIHLHCFENLCVARCRHDWGLRTSLAK